MNDTTQLDKISAIDFPDIREDHFGNDHTIYPTERNMRALIDYHNILIGSINTLIRNYNTLNETCNKLKATINQFSPNQ